MILHIVIISLQCAALAGFLILWYYWIKKNIEATNLPNEDCRVFPFRSFAWVFIGIVFVSCVLQVHFVRVSATVHERLAAMAHCYQNQEQNTRSLEELKATVERLRRDMETNFKVLRVQSAGGGHAGAMNPVRQMSAAKGDSLDTSGPMDFQVVRIMPSDAGFAKEAKSSSTATSINRAAQSRRKANDIKSQAFSMPLSRMGRVVQDNLSVKKRPINDSPVLEHLTAGQAVKVTEKRLLNDEMWFRVITPSGRAGWVDYRRVRLEGNS